MKKPRASWAQVGPDDWLSTGDAAIVLRCTPRTVQRLAVAGELGGLETWGGQWIFRRREVDAYQRASGGRLVPASPAIATKADPQLPLRFPRPQRLQPRSWRGARFRMAKAAWRAKVADPVPDPKRAARTGGTHRVA